MPSAQLLAAHASKEDMIELLDLIDEVRTVGTEHQFKNLIHQCSKLVPIDRVHASVATLDKNSNIVATTRQVNINFPTHWLKEYRAQGLVSVDPAAKQLFRTDHPVVWNQLRKQHRDRSSQAFFSIAADFGLREGFTFGARIAATSTGSFFTCEGDGLTGHARHIAIVTYLLPHLHAALAKVHLGMLKDPPVLTEREREVLHWTMYGKTDAEIALQLNVSPRTVKFHVENAMKKLQANNRAQAMAIALSQGLINWG